jgi:hypothetical protein
MDTGFCYKFLKYQQKLYNNPNNDIYMNKLKEKYFGEFKESKPKFQKTTQRIKIKEKKNQNWRSCEYVRHNEKKN